MEDASAGNGGRVSCPELKPGEPGRRFNGFGSVGSRVWRHIDWCDRSLDDARNDTGRLAKAVPGLAVFSGRKGPGTSVASLHYLLQDPSCGGLIQCPALALNRNGAPAVTFGIRLSCRHTTSPRPCEGHGNLYFHLIRSYAAHSSRRSHIGQSHRFVGSSAAPVLPECCSHRLRKSL